MQIKYYKYQSSGNSFVLIDNLNVKPLSNQVISKIISTNEVRDSDGLLLLYPSEKFDFKLDPLLTNEIRFFIMSLLAMYEEVDFKFLTNVQNQSEDQQSQLDAMQQEIAELKAMLVQFLAKLPA